MKLKQFNPWSIDCLPLEERETGNLRRRWFASENINFHIKTYLSLYFDYGLVRCEYILPSVPLSVPSFVSFFFQILNANIARCQRLSWFQEERQTDRRRESRCEVTPGCQRHCQVALSASDLEITRFNVKIARAQRRTITRSIRLPHAIFTP